MLQKTYSESIYLEPKSAKSVATFTSSLHIATQKSYRTAIYLVPTLVPQRTIYAMNSALPTVYNQSCNISDSGLKSYESSASFSHHGQSSSDIPCYQSIDLEPRLVMKNYSESVNVFRPKNVEHSFNSIVIYDGSSVKTTYVAGIEVQKRREVDLESSFESFKRIVLTHGALVNGV